MYIITQNRKSILNIKDKSLYITETLSHKFEISTGNNGCLEETLGFYKSIEEARDVLLQICEFIEEAKKSIFAMPRFYV